MRLELVAKSRVHVWSNAGGRLDAGAARQRRLTTTALYTRVAITDLREVIARCHPRMHTRRLRTRR